MNKLFIVLLAVCLVSVHAFVKREAEAPKPETFNLDEFSNTIRDKFKIEPIDPEQMKKGFNDFVEKVQGAFDQLNAKIKDGKE